MRIYIGVSIGLIVTCLCFLGDVRADEKGRTDEKSSKNLQGNRSKGQGLALIAAGSKFYFLAHKIELPTHRYGKIALFDLDVGVDKSRPQVLQSTPAPPKDWQQRGLGPSDDGVRIGTAPFGSRSHGSRCRCSTVVSKSSNERLAVLYASHSFVLPPDIDFDTFSMISMKVEYRDALTMTLNGEPLVSRHMATSADGEVTALRKRGPEPEHFLIALKPGLIRPGKNVLAIEIRPGKSSNGIRFDMEMSLRDAGRLVRGPILQEVGQGSALIAFDTDIAQSASVVYGKRGQLEHVERSAQGALARHHRVALVGLRPGQAVYYQIVIGSIRYPVEVFHMPPKSDKPLRFAVYGDTRGGHRVHGKIVDSLLEEAIDFVIVTGDLVLRGSDEADWQRFFEVAAPLLARLPYYPVVGNHDLGRSGDEKRRMNEIFSLWPRVNKKTQAGDWHSFTVSGVHFVMLDSNKYRSREQLQWLAADLRKARKAGARAIFAAVHAGPYSRGLHQGHSYAAEHYAPVLKRYGVNLLFSGHEHLYQRGQMRGLDYIVSGGGGAPLYSVRCGVPGRKPCKHKDGMQYVAKEYHYILVTVFPRHIEICPKRIDRSPLEACIRYPL